MFGHEMFFADPENNMEYHEEHHESRRHPLPENQNNSKLKSQLPRHFLQESVDKSTEPSNYESPHKKNLIHKSQSSSQQDVSSMSIYEISCSFQLISMILNPSYFLFKTCKLFDDVAVEAKLEATTRKLQRGYQQAENGLYTTVL